MREVFPEPTKIEDLDNTGTLFEDFAFESTQVDEQLLDRLVDEQQISYGEARQLVEAGYTLNDLSHSEAVPEVSRTDEPLTGEQTSSEAPLGVAVSLKDRADALQDITKFYNKKSQVVGSQKQRAMPGSDFNRRYGDYASEVQSGAEAKVSKLYSDFMRGIETLNATQQMVEAGLYTDNEAEMGELAIRGDLNRTYGVGVEDGAKMRRQLIKTTSAVDKKSVVSKK